MIIFEKLCFFVKTAMTNSEIMPKAQKYKSIVRKNIETVSTKQYSRMSRDLKINTLGSINQEM